MADKRTHIYSEIKTAIQTISGLNIIETTDFDRFNNVPGCYIGLFGEANITNLTENQNLELRELEIGLLLIDKLALDAAKSGTYRNKIDEWIDKLDIAINKKLFLTSNTLATTDYKIQFRHFDLVGVEADMPRDKNILNIFYFGKLQYTIEWLNLTNF